MQSIDELRGKVESLREEIATLADAEELTDEQNERFDAALVEFEEARSAFEQAEARAAKVAEVRAFAASEKNVKPTFEPVNVNTRASVWDVDELRGAPPEKRATEIRARALDAIEKDGRRVASDAGLEDLARRMSSRGKVSNALAELVIQTGSPEYQDAFERYTQNPGDSFAKMELDKRQSEIMERAALSMPAVAGAVTIPYQLDPTVILTNAGVVSPIRQVCRNVQITGTNIWQFNTSAGVSASLLAENTEVSDGTPTFTSTQITAYKMAAYAYGSYESIADSGWNNELAMMFADAKARAEGTYLATGTGSSQPQGLVTFASNATSVFAGTSGAANAADLIASDIYDIRASLSPRWRGPSVWFGNLAIAHKIRQLGTSTNFHAFTLDLTQDSDQLRLLGKPFYEVSDMDSTIVSGSTDFVLIHGDPTKFAVVDRVGSQLYYQPIVTGASGRPTAQAGWLVLWRFGSGGEVQDAFRSYKL